MTRYGGDWQTKEKTMKLRIRGDSLRLRVVRSELEALQRSGRTSDRIQFPDERALTYSIEVAADAAAISAHFLQDEIVVRIPSSQASKWFDEREVGLESHIEATNGASLRVLIEKDFPCLEVRPGEDDSEAFARPS